MAPDPLHYPSTCEYFWAKRWPWMLAMIVAIIVGCCLLFLAPTKTFSCSSSDDDEDCVGGTKDGVDTSYAIAAVVFLVPAVLICKFSCISCRMIDRKEFFEARRQRDLDGLTAKQRTAKQTGMESAMVGAETMVGGGPVEITIGAIAGAFGVLAAAEEGDQRKKKGTTTTSSMQNLPQSPSP